MRSLQDAVLGLSKFGEVLFVYFVSVLTLNDDLNNKASGLTHGPIDEFHVSLALLPLRCAGLRFLLALHIQDKP